MTSWMVHEWVLWMVRFVCRDWIRYAICNMEPWLSFSRFCFQTIFLVQEQVIKDYLTCLFSWLGKTNFYIRDPLFFPLVNTPTPVPLCDPHVWRLFMNILVYLHSRKNIHDCTGSQVYYAQERQQPGKRNAIKINRFVALPRWNWSALSSHI